jgi:hypothetical protein
MFVNELHAHEAAVYIFSIVVIITAIVLFLIVLIPTRLHHVRANYASRCDFIATDQLNYSTFSAATL